MLAFILSIIGLLVMIGFFLGKVPGKIAVAVFVFNFIIGGIISISSDE